MTNPHISRNVTRSACREMFPSSRATCFVPSSLKVSAELRKHASQKTNNKKHGSTLLLCINGGSCHKYNFCRDKHVSGQNTSFVATKVCLPRQNFRRNKMFVATNVLSRQAYFFRDKNLFCRVKYNFVVYRDKIILVPTNVLSRQSVLLARQNTNKRLSQQTRVCRERSFFSTKIILVAAPANDSYADVMVHHRAPASSTQRYFFQSDGSARDAFSRDDGSFVGPSWPFLCVHTPLYCLH